MYNTALQFQARSSDSESLPLLDLGQITSVFWAPASFGVTCGSMVISQVSVRIEWHKAHAAAQPRATSGLLTPHSCSFLCFHLCTSAHQGVAACSWEANNCYIQGTGMPWSSAFDFLLLFCIAEFLQWMGIIFIKTVIPFYIYLPSIQCPIWTLSILIALMGRWALKLETQET